MARHLETFGCQASICVDNTMPDRDRAYGLGVAA
jgi:hypothetical protein